MLSVGDLRYKKPRHCDFSLQFLCVRGGHLSFPCSLLTLLPCLGGPWPDACAWKQGLYFTTPAASSVSAFKSSAGYLGTCLFWCGRFEWRGGRVRRQQVLATLFLTLINLCASSRARGFLPLTAAPWTVAKRMIELEKSREGSLCSMEESYPEEIEWSMCV